MSFDLSMLDPSIIEQYESMGVRTDLLQDLFSKVPPDPISGQIGPEEVMRYMIKNVNNPLVQELGQTTQKALKDRLDSLDPDFNDFDFDALADTIPDTVEGGSWYVSLDRYAFVNLEGNYVKEEDAPKIPGVQPKFFLTCEHSSVIRAMDDIVGLPDSKSLLRFIKRSIAAPIPGIQLSLPRHLLISVKLSQHKATLQPFLNSLPAPFSWSIETTADASQFMDALDQRMQYKYEKYMEIGEAAKQAGNAAFKQKDRETAVLHYTEAIDLAVDSMSQRPTDEQRKAASRLAAICLANRAASYLLPGEGVDYKKALEDSEAAERWDADYGKAYYRQAKALEALGDIAKAQDALRRALARPALATDKAMLALLNELDVQLD